MFLGKLEQAFIERKKMPEEILEMYKNGTLQSFLSLNKPLSDIFPTQDDFIQELERVWKLLSISYFKRIQCPPVITLGKASFGFDFREAQNPHYLTRKYRKVLADMAL